MESGSRAGGSWAKYAGFRRTTGFSVNRQRGQLVESALAPYVTATVHPSSNSACT